MELNFAAARSQMVTQQVRAWDVLDPAVLDALTAIPREVFVPARYRAMACADTAIPLGAGASMLTPQVAGRLLQSLELGAGDEVLEVGTGTGFLAAALAQLTGRVQSLEINAELASTARRNLADTAGRKVEVVQANVFDWTPPGSYDVIAVTGSLPRPERRFQEWLKVGGRMFVVVGQAPVMEAQLVRRLGPSEWSITSLFETELAPLHHAVQPTAFTF
jgi:protein-L-isoaspartate(D-aspartate) O-methyltransferase